MQDAFVYDRRFRSFNLVDGFHHEMQVIGIDLYIPAQCIIRVLYRIDILVFYLFKTLNEVRDVTEHQLIDTTVSYLNDPLRI
jgi:hypothetical protein